jgi:excisionase family DNA binding protein
LSPAPPPRAGADASTPEPETVSITKACRLTGMGRTKLYQLMGDGVLPSVKIGKRRLLRLDTLRRVLASLERAGLEEAV